MIEFLIVAVLATVVVVRVVALRRAALRRARARAEAVLDDLAATACARLADGASSRRATRALDRYERTRERVAQARTCGELEALVARHAARRRAADLAERSLVRARTVLVAGVLLRR